MFLGIKHLLGGWPRGLGGAPGLLSLGVALAHIYGGIMSVLTLSRVWGGGELVRCVRDESSVHAPRLPRFIQLGSFSDTLHVVSILDIAYDCHLGGFAVLKELLIVPVGTMGSF